MNTDNGSTGDPWGDTCEDYEVFPSWCGNYNDDDFISEEMCCVCGGGSTVADPDETDETDDTSEFDLEDIFN